MHGELYKKAPWVTLQCCDSPQLSTWWEYQCNRMLMFLCDERLTSRNYTFSRFHKVDMGKTRNIYIFDILHRFPSFSAWITLRRRLLASIPMMDSSLLTCTTKSKQEFFRTSQSLAWHFTFNIKSFICFVFHLLFDLPTFTWSHHACLPISWCCC